MTNGDEDFGGQPAEDRHIVRTHGLVFETVPETNTFTVRMERPPFTPVPFPPDNELITNAPLLDRVSEARRKKLIPPEWIVDHSVPILYRHGHMELLFHIPVTITEVIWDEHKYIVPDFKRKTVQFALALPIDHMGRYTASTLHVVSPAKNLPHVHRQGACLGLADGPAAITNIGHYHEMKSVITRAMTQINLASLYSGKDEWPKEIRQALPMGTRGLRSEQRHKRFNVAITKYFVHKEDPIWQT